MSITKFAVAGATGRLGRHLVDVLGQRGHQVVPMSRATGVDIITGEGLAEALAPETSIPEIAGPRTETAAEVARLLGARRGIKVVDVDGSGMPDADCRQRRVPAQPARQARRPHLPGVARHPTLTR